MCLAGFLSEASERRKPEKHVSDFVRIEHNYQQAGGSTRPPASKA
jgi:hypothetical protein